MVRFLARLTFPAALIGGLLLAACGGAGTAMPLVAFLLLGGATAAALGGLAAGCRDSDAFQGCYEGTRPLAAEVPTGWYPCCIDREVMLCPTEPPGTSCNYNRDQTFCPDGVTCGPTNQDPCNAAQPDAATGGIGDAGLAETGP
jgi:hypothetical protein